MKVQLTIDLELEPEKELRAKEQANVTAMMRRVCARRLEALRGQRLGGERHPVGWEVTVRGIDVGAPSKVK